MGWLRDEKVDISKYLPEFVRGDPVLGQTLAIESDEHEQQRLEIRDLLAQAFINTATWGLSDWERILALKPAPSDSYEQRRNRILLKLQSHNTSTLDFMAAVAGRYIDNKKAKIEEHNNLYYFNVATDGTITDEKGLINAINLYKPAHLSFGLHFQRNATGILHIGAAADNATRYNMFPAIAQDSSIKAPLCIVPSYGAHIINSINPVAGTGANNNACNTYGVAPYIMKAYFIQERMV